MTKTRLKMWQSILVLTVLALGCKCDDEDIYPCDGNNRVVINTIPGVYPGEENQYILTVAQNIQGNTKIQLRFDSEANLELAHGAQASLRASQNTATINVFKRSPLGVGLRVQGDPYGSLPYLRSLIINSVEYCEYPQSGYLDFLTGGTSKPVSVGGSVHPVESGGCGRRKVDHTELIVNGYPSKPGDWPWHVALFELEGNSLTYRCGGTLISRTVVLTAAHCVKRTDSVMNPEGLNVLLGKHNLLGGDISPQEKEVLKIVVHDGFQKQLLHNDIALLKLKTEAVYSNYVQPACLWSAASADRYGGAQVFGTVAGWGLDHTNNLNPVLQQATIPMIPESTCMRTKPDFYSRILTDQKFCAGYRNGTSACNGDSGGAFTVFVPDSPGSTVGSYHVRGIVSTTVSRPGDDKCDPNYYVVFTDVSKYNDWIARNIN